MAWHAPGRLQRAWHDTPRLGVALRAAIAASVAWAVASLLPEPLAEYPYYAPFGAVIATTLSLAGSIRESIQAVSSIAIGGLIAWLVAPGCLPRRSSPSLLGTEIGRASCRERVKFASGAG